jgi:hypothetical protein
VISNPAPASNMTESATSAATSTVRHRRVERLDDVPRPVLQRRDQLEARALKSAQETKHERSDERQPAGKEHDARVDADRCLRGKLARTERLVSQKPLHGPRGDRDAEDTADRPQEHELGRQLSDQSSSPRAERRTDGHLARAFETAPQQQARHVRARDEEHRRHGSRDQQQRRAQRLDPIVLQTSHDHALGSLTRG